MKKTIALLLMILMVFSLAACVGNQEQEDVLPEREDSTTPTTQVNRSDTDVTPNAVDEYNDIIDGTDDTIWGEQSDDIQQSILDAAKEQGVDAKFGDDGSTIITDPETGEVFMQNPDGTYSYKDAEGGVGQTGDNWPDNEFTRLVPRPDFAITQTYGTDTDFTVVFEASIEQIRAYAQQLADAGFSVDPETQDQETMGIVVYSYGADNADAYHVELAFVSGISSMILSK